MEKFKFRNELKHYINFSDSIALSKRLKLICRKDSHVGEDGKYKITSLYFDNIYDKALREKIDGINNREKFRIRYYNDDFSFMNLEKKSKKNGLCNKRSSRISKVECEQLLKGDIDWLLNSGDSLLIELYSKMRYQILRPKTIVEYTREPFIYPLGNVRITIDSEIKTGLLDTDIFEKKPNVKTPEQNFCILEVKFDEFVPDLILDLVQISNRKSTAFSKYGVSRIYF